MKRAHNKSTVQVKDRCQIHEAMRLNIAIPFVALLIGMLCLSSCARSDRQYIARSPDGVLIIGGLIRNGKPDGVWKYYDENGDLTKQAFYSRNRLETIEFYSNENLIYIESYDDDVIQKRIAFGVNDGYEGGAYILNAKCNSCHHVSDNGIAPSIDFLVTEKKLFDYLTFSKAFKKDSNKLDSMHKKIPLSEFEIKDIIRCVELTDEMLPSN